MRRLMKTRLSVTKAHPNAAGSGTQEVRTHADRFSPHRPSRIGRTPVMHPLIRELERTTALTAGDIDRFIAENSFPLIERFAVTFVYRGEADAVRLRHWLKGPVAAPELKRLGESDLWHLTVAIPEGSRIEYKFDVINGGTHGWINDPLNPLVAEDPFGANSVCQAYGYETPDWSLPDEAAPSGRFEDLTIASAAFGEPRAVRVYLPAGYRDDQNYPLVVAHDGEDFEAYAGLATVLDNLIDRGDIAPVVVALTQSPDRMREYVDDLRHAAFLCDELLPQLHARYALSDEAAGRALMGASLGAIASLTAAWRRPGVFGRLLLKSGSFMVTETGFHGRDPVFERIHGVMAAFRDHPGALPPRIFVSCGLYEGLIKENRALVDFLREHGADVMFVEALDGHHWQNWRDQLRAGLAWVFPEPPDSAGGQRPGADVSRSQ